MKRKLSTLCRMNDADLRAWMRRVWDQVTPDRTTNFWDQWERAMSGYIILPDDDVEFHFRWKGVDGNNGFEVRHRAITRSAINASPYQALRP